MKNKHIHILIGNTFLLVNIAVLNAEDATILHDGNMSSNNVRPALTTLQEFQNDRFFLKMQAMNIPEPVIWHQPQSFTNDLQNHFVRLKTIAENPATNKHARINAILDIGDLGLTNAVPYLFDNIDVCIEFFAYMGDDAGLRERPYFYALMRKGKAVIPDVLTYLDTPRSDHHLKIILSLLLSVIKSDIETYNRFLFQLKKEALSLPDAKTRLENINKLLLIHFQEKLE